MQGEGQPQLNGNGQFIGPLGLGNAGTKRERRKDLKGSFHEQQSHPPGDKVGIRANCRPILRRLKKPKFKFKGVTAMGLNKWCFQDQGGGQLLHL